MSVNYCFVVLAFMAEDWIGKCLNSIRSQKVQDFRCIVIDDNSQDRTFEIAHKFIADNNRFILKRNTKRRYQIENILCGIPKVSSNPNDVIIIINAFDWLKHPRVLVRLNKEYNDLNTWMTYSGYETYKNTLRYNLGLRHKRVYIRQIPYEVAAQGFYRYYEWQDNTFVTFKRFLWDRIEVKDLKNLQGNYYKLAGELAWIFPILEMAGFEHSKYIHDFLYIYNKDVQTRTENLNLMEKIISEHEIRFVPSYNKIVNPLQVTSDLNLIHDTNKPEPNGNKKTIFKHANARSHICLNLGCGTDIREGFINMDIRKMSGIGLRASILNIPIRDNSVAFILFYDALEHFSINDSISILKNCYRILKPLGDIDIRVPHLTNLYRLHVEGILDARAYQQHIYGNQDYNENYHKSGYTPELLSNICKDIGYNTISIIEEAGNFRLTAKKIIT